MIQDWVVPVHVESQFFTDDNFQFNGAVRALQNFFEDLNDYHKDQDEYEEIEKNCISSFSYFKNPETVEQNDLGIVENDWMYADIEDFDAFYDFIKRKYFMKSLKVLFPLYKKEWAKSTIKTFLKNIYKQIEKFSKSDIEILNEMMDEIDSKTNANTMRINNSLFLDSKINSNAAQGFNPVADGRGTRFVVDNLGTWAGKQY